MGVRELYLDFEFSRVTSSPVNLVCCVTYDNVTKEYKRFWLHRRKKAKARLRRHLKKYNRFIAYSAIAECRSFLALGLNPLDFDWVDLFIEYRMMCNHNNDLLTGRQLVNGRVITAPVPLAKWERTEGYRGFKPTHSLIEATFKLLKKRVDEKHKEEMRDLIISDPKSFSEEEKKWIMDYCQSDVVNLPEIRKEIFKHFKKKVSNNKQLAKAYVGESLWRGRYAAHTSLMEDRGYPINLEATKNFSKQVGNILYDIQREINDLFPDIKPFKWSKRTQKFSWNQIATRNWVKENHTKEELESWMKTDKKALSLSLEAFEKMYSFRHDYPKDNFGAQMVRYLRLKQSLYGFNADPNSSRKNFWDAVGPDGMVRPYMNIYGAQSSRSQPAATGFMFLKPAWMRALVQPPKGYFICGMDWGAQEFFTSALLANDKNMIDAYESGDPYLYQAKLSGAIPQDATKETHKFHRNLFKATTLGISFLMSKVGLAVKLTNDTGQKWDQDAAQGMINTFYENFSSLKEYQDSIVEGYADKKFIKLEDGWYIWGDNPNPRSVSNAPVQGAAACAMREAVDLAVVNGVDILFTLHDAVYMIGKVGRDENKILTLRDAMIEGFANQFSSKVEVKLGIYDRAKNIRIDPFMWGPDLEKDSEIKLDGGKFVVPCSDIYVDERAINDYQKFSQYFNPRIEDEL